MFSFTRGVKYQLSDRNIFGNASFLLTQFGRLDDVNPISLVESNISFPTTYIHILKSIPSTGLLTAQIEKEIDCSYRGDNIPANNIITNFTIKYI